MNCQSFENNVTELARRQPLEANALDEALSHSESCPACAMRLNEQRALTLALRNAAEELDAVQVSDEIESQLVAAFRQQMMSPRVAATSRRWVAMAAIAAMLLVVSAAIALRLSSVPAPPLVKQESTPAPANETTPKQLTESGITNNESAANHDTPATHSPRRLLARTHRQKPAVNMAVTEPLNSNRNALVAEVTTDFMPLGDTSIATLQDGAQVVRVEMPRYAMARFGLPVNMERYDEKVKADVWVGIDGLARAIRFVQ